MKENNTSKAVWKKLKTKPISERTKEEMEITYVMLMQEQLDKQKSIANNMSFFFWITIFAAIIGFGSLLLA